MKQIKIKNIFSIDLEDWFHILDVKLDDWEAYPSRIEKNTYKLIEILNSKEIKTTIFVLGWIAEKYPYLVKELELNGHEIASHGYYHKLVYQQTKSEFKEDIYKSKIIIEDLLGKEVYGYRAPGMSITSSMNWPLKIISDVGYIYDSSLFGGHNILNTPYKVNINSARELIEFPMASMRIFNKNICFCGGGYFRLYPYKLSKVLLSNLNMRNKSFTFYIHPRDIDVNQPKLKMNLYKGFKTYINLNGTLEKVNQLVEDFNFTSCISYINGYFELTFKI